VAVGQAVANGPLGGVYEYLEPAVPHVSMVMMASPTLILAAPQQSPVSQMVSGFLLSLKVPFDRAFSHLAPAFPLPGASLSSMSLEMALSLVALSASAVARVLAYASYLTPWHLTMAASCSVSLVLISPFLVLIKVT
jgi:hypothetical protein